MSIGEDFRFNAATFDIYSALTAGIWRLGIVAHHSTGLRRLVLRVVYAVANNIWTKAIIGSDLSPSVTLGRRVSLPHGGRGVFVSDGVTIGDDCTIHQQVCIGMTLGKDGAPTIGDRVYLGVKASVLGPVAVGADSTVGAHALVIHDVPERCTAAGVPAQSKQKPVQHHSLS